METESVCVHWAIPSGHGGSGLLDGFNPAMGLSAPVGGMINAAPVVNSSFHATNNISGEQLP